jgi:hypothetical protein
VWQFSKDQKMKTFVVISCIAGLLFCSGCDAGVHEGTSPAADATTSPGVNVDVNTSPVETRAERREALRENLRDTIDGVQVDVGDGVQVDVGDGRVKVDVDRE